MNSLLIRIPNNNIKERSYIIKTLLTEFLNIQCEISIHNSIEEYQIQFMSTTIIIEDHFFSQYKNSLSYLKLENIPPFVNESKIVKYNNDKNLIIIYGKDEIIFNNASIKCGIDIFASAFYMLSRWEEAVLNKDEFGRCNEDSMLSIKNGFFSRPVVNEYVEFLKELLIKVGVNVSDNRKFLPFITHDVDDLFRYASVKNFFRNLAGDLLHRKNLIAFYTTCKNYILFKAGKIKDPFDTFDELMDISDSYGLKDAFYFIPLTNNEKGKTYDIFDTKVKKIIGNIISRGHEVGFHPSKLTFQNQTQFEEEFKRLQSVCDLPIIGGRQHYLLYDLKCSFDTWNSINTIVYDCGIGFSKHIGFRTGCCFEYHLFNIFKREELRIIERPMIFMEKTILFDNLTPVTMINEINKYIGITRLYSGIFVMLWHVENFNRYGLEQYRSVYKVIIKNCS